MESSKITASEKESNHQRYLTLFDHLRRRDAELARALDDLRRSTAIERLAAMYDLRVVSDDELGAFSEDTQRRVRGLVELMAT